MFPVEFVGCRVKYYSVGSPSLKVMAWWSDRTPMWLSTWKSLRMFVPFAVEFLKVRSMMDAWPMVSSLVGM